MQNSWQISISTEIITSNEQLQLHPEAVTKIFHSQLLDFPHEGLSGRCEGHESKAVSTQTHLFVRKSHIHTQLNESSIHHTYFRSKKIPTSIDKQ